MSVDERFLIGLDVDGTVLTEAGTLSPAVADAVRLAAEAGHEVTLATGRSWGTTEEVLHLLEIEPEYVVCANGALVMRRDPAAPGQYIRFAIETFDPREVLTLINGHLGDARFMVEYPDGFRRYTHGMSDWNLDNAEEVSFDGLLAEPVTRVVVMSPEHSEEEFLKIVESIGLHQVSYAIGWTAWLDIAPLGVSKATALEKVRLALGFEPSQVVVAGDGRNDIEMFQWAAKHGTAVAMGQAPDVVKAEATRVTANVEQDGLALFLHDLLSSTTSGTR